MHVIVVNKYHGAKGTYIGRGSPLGNPYRISSLITREEAIAAYEKYLEAKIQENDPEIIEELTRLYHLAAQATAEDPLKLVCFCAPKACHGDVIKAVLLRAHENQGEKNDG